MPGVDGPPVGRSRAVDIPLALQQEPQVDGRLGTLVGVPGIDGPLVGRRRAFRVP